jgi:hypothetical protein
VTDMSNPSLAPTMRDTENYLTVDQLWVNATPGRSSQRSLEFML